VWFSSIFLRTLRSYRIAILGWGIGMGVLVLEPMAAASTLVGTAAGRASLTQLASAFAFNAAPVAVDTAAGYATWKIGVFILVMVIWPLLAGARMVRGEEERGSMDVLLSVPRTRARVVLEKLAAMWVALLAMAALIGVILFAGSRSFNPGYGFGDALLFGLDLALICAVFGGLALVLSQFTVDRRKAAGWTAGVLLVAVVVDSLHRLFPGTEWISRISPVYYYNLSKPLIPSYGTSAGGMVLLLALSLVLGVAGAWLFTRRDIGGVVPLPGWLRLPRRAAPRRHELPVRDWSLRGVYARALAKIAVATFWWTVGIAGFAAFMVVAVKQVEHTLSTLTGSVSASSSFMVTLIERVGGGDVQLNATILSAIFVILPVLLMAFAVTQVSAWASDEEEGRLELVLSTPQSRQRVLLGRFAALATATVVIGVVTLVASAAAAAAVGLELDGGNLAAATLGIIPLGLLVAAIGYLAAGWLRAAVDTGLVSLLLAAWFFITFVGPELQWPDVALRLSALYYYGTPLLHGLQATYVVGLLAVAALALAVSTWRFTSKDLVR
jgi:ABC-2 type transport system permease protein